MEGGGGDVKRFSYRMLGAHNLLTLRSKKDGLSVCCYVEVVEVAVRRTNEKAAEIKHSLCTR